MRSWGKKELTTEFCALGANGRSPAQRGPISVAFGAFTKVGVPGRTRRGAKAMPQFLGRRRGCNFRLAGGYQSV
jgi:hypothetical protein